MIVAIPGLMILANDTPDPGEAEGSPTSATAGLSGPQGRGPAVS